MSLKALVQLFAEKFLVSKKEWAAEQPAISPSDSIMLSVTADGENHNFTMPCTGYANLRGYGVWFADINGCALINLGPDANGISASISTPKRVNSLDMLWGLVPNSLRLISIFTRPKAVSNLVVGGASC